MRSLPGAYTSTHGPKLLNEARPRQSPPSAPTATTSEKAAGQLSRRMPLLPAAATHTPPPYWCSCPSHSRKAISGKSCLDMQEMHRWKMSTPRPNQDELVEIGS